MDEPTAHLDYRNEFVFLETLTELCKNDGLAVLFAMAAVLLFGMEAYNRKRA